MFQPLEAYRLAWFNLLEATVWFAVSSGFFLHLYRGYSATQRMALLGGLLFGLFGLSDLAEIYTGAWWRPPALMWAKGTCILGLLSLYLMYRRTRNEKDFGSDGQ